MDILIQEIDSVFPGINVIRGKVHNYLGLTFDFTECDGVKITAKQFMNDFLEDYNDVQGTATTPAEDSLFSINHNAPKLSDKDRQRFHTCTARLLYISKRIRPDILLAISFLASRVLAPTTQDESKLHRVIRYLRSTSDLGLKLECNLSNLEVYLQAYIDASYAIHEDAKSHTGSIITLGKGSFYARSKKQGINTISSTESELVGLTEGLGNVIWCRNWLIAQRYTSQPATVYQDNQSTIKMVENGETTSNRTRHIATRYFFAHDRVKTGEIQLKYKPTEDMIADLLTKPLQGKAFRKLRDLLLNCKCT
jgi:hypothetical protein